MKSKMILLLIAIYLTWNAGATEPTDYVVYRWNGVELVMIGSTERPEYVDNDVTAGETYCYKVEGLTAGGKYITPLMGCVVAD